jgi:asparagine synthase (glutamine-hydrolysing)
MASDLTTYLPGDLLVKVDRMTMATSLEARSPFLDHQLTEVAARLPVEQKFPNGNLKAITKEILKKTLPQDLIDRPKAGFGVPLNDWFAGELSGWVRELLLGEQCTGRGFLNRTGMERLLNEHVKTNGRAGHGHRLWLLVLFELWCRTFLDQRGTTPINVSL